MSKFIVEASEKFKGWEVFSSGGGCYHAIKDFKTLGGQVIGVEVHWSGSAMSYHVEDEPQKFVSMQEVFSDELQTDWLLLAYLEEDTNYLNADKSLALFTPSDVQEITKTLADFTELYDQAFEGGTL